MGSGSLIRSPATELEDEAAAGFWGERSVPLFGKVAEELLGLVGILRQPVLENLRRGQSNPGTSRRRLSA